MLSLTFSNSSNASSTGFLSSSEILSLSSSSCFFVENIICSAWLWVSTVSFHFLSSFACSSASFFIFSISLSLSPLDDSIVICCSLLVALSFAETFKIPFASISNDTSICGIPLGAGGIPSNVNLPSVLLPAACDLSPCKTCISTAGWLSAAVLNISVFLAGMVVFLSINFVDTPPNVSIPNDNGVTSSNNTSFTSPCNTPPWIAAPNATTSSGFTVLLGSLPNISFTNFCTEGIRVEPPTKIISSISPFKTPASFIASIQGCFVFSTKSSVSWSNLALEIVIFRCLGPLESAVKYGRLISVCFEEDNSIFPFSAASFNLWTTIGSLEISIPSCFLYSLIK